MDNQLPNDASLEVLSEDQKEIEISYPKNVVMDKSILGNHTINQNTVITEINTGVKFKVKNVTSKGLELDQITTISNPVHIFVSYDELKKSFVNGDIAISGYDINDNKILYLVVNDLQNTPEVVEVRQIRNVQQYKKTGFVKVKKKANSKVKKVLEEFKAGKLKSSSGEKVRSHKQAIAIALSEQRRENKNS